MQLLHNPFPCKVNVEGWSEAQCETANEDKGGQDSPGPGVTHSQGDMAHYDSPFAKGWEHERQSVGVDGDGVCKEKRQFTANGGKWQLITKSLVQPSLPRGRVPLWLDSLWRQILAQNFVHQQQAW